MDYDHDGMERVTRERPNLLRVLKCTCGRPFTTAGGRANHAHHCAVELAVRGWELAAVTDALERALARLAVSGRPIGRPPRK